MNILVASQYGQVRGQITDCGLLLEAEAQTPRGDVVRVKASLDAANQLLYLLAILRAVEKRIEQVQLKDFATAETDCRDESLAPGTDHAETDLFETDGSRKHKIYGRFPQFRIYEQFDQGRLRVFFAVRDDQKRVARFDLHAGEVQAFCTLAERALLAHPEIDLVLRDELSLAVALSASRKGLVFDVQTPLWQGHFLIGKAQNLGTLAVFLERSLNGAKAAPIRFQNDSSGLVLRKRTTDGRVLAEFHSGESSERLTLSSLQLYEMEVVARYVLRLCFEPEAASRCEPLPENLVAAARG